jgi:hypothetical protein
MASELEAGAAAPVIDETATSVAAQTNAATTEGQTDGQSDENDSPAAEKTFTQKELDEILQKRLAKAQRTARREALQEFAALQPRQQPEPKQTDDGKPARAQYADDEAYVDALTDWKLDQRDKVAKAESAKQQAQTVSKKIDQLYAEASKLDGFDAEAYDELPLTRAMVEAVLDSDVAPALMKHMADNPEEVERIAKLSPARQAAELGKLEAKLDSPAPAKKHSSAPDPITPLRKPNGAAKTFDTTDPRAAKELSTSEWIRLEEARMRKKAAGTA